MAQSMFSTSPVWSVCIPTLASRKKKLARLLDVLLPQAEEYFPQVEILALHNNGERGLGPVKQDLLHASNGLYFSLVDDDDMVEPDFVEAVLAAMSTRADYISFDHAYYENGARHPKPVRTGLDMPGWGHGALDAQLPYLARDVTQVNPMLTKIALQGEFRQRANSLEDGLFVEMVRPLLKTQARIDRILYHYFHDVNNSNQSVLAPHTYDEPLVVKSRVFHWIEPSGRV